jgi:hypothetical protein
MMAGEALGLACGAVPGLGAAGGAIVEAGVSNAAEIAIGRMRRSPGPMVDGKPIKVSPPMQSRHNSPGCELRTWHMRPEDFDLYQQDGLVPVLEKLKAGCDPLEVESMVDTLHVVDVSDTARIFFEHHGYNTPGSNWQGRQLSDIPWPARHEQAWEAYIRVKLRNQPAYDYVWRKSGETVVAYNRLLYGLTDDFGRVQSVVMAANREAA